MHDSLRARFRTFVNRMMQATRVLPSVGFGRAAEPPTESIQQDEQTQDLTADRELHEQQHPAVPSRAVGKRPRN